MEKLGVFIIHFHFNSHRKIKLINRELVANKITIMYNNNLNHNFSLMTVHNNNYNNNKLDYLQLIFK